MRMQISSEGMMICAEELHKAEKTMYSQAAVIEELCSRMREFESSLDQAEIISSRLRQHQELLRSDVSKVKKLAHALEMIADHYSENESIIQDMIEPPCAYEKTQMVLNNIVVDEEMLRRNVKMV